MDTTLIDTAKANIDALTQAPYQPLDMCGTTPMVYKFLLIFTLIEFVALVILAIAYSRLRKRVQQPTISKSDIKKKVKAEGDIDMKERQDNMWKAPKLYDQLKVKYHPDRFVTDKQKYVIAEDLATRIGAAKHNYKDLRNLQKEAEEKLGK